MDGTTLCPHCDTRFKIARTQLDAHQGMVRCGHCRSAFDARVNFVPNEPHPQLELVIPEAPVEILCEPEAVATVQEASPDTETVLPAAGQAPLVQDEIPDDSLDFSIPPTSPDRFLGKAANSEVRPEERPMTLAEQVEVVSGSESEQAPRPSRTLLWAGLSALMTLLLIAQAAYFFRADIAARMPELRPALEGYCELLSCKVGLPQNDALMSIESSSLEADPRNAARITLTALLRNRADYVLAYPNLELTLNDRQDKPLARRTFKPQDYLPSRESEGAGLQANHELGIQLRLDTTDLDPNGYRLAVYYPN